MEIKEKNKRKLLLAIPTLILPFLALAFYALGGGQGGASSQQQHVRKGINTNLPDAQFKERTPQDKLSFYQQAKRDSANNKNELGNSLIEKAKTDQSDRNFKLPSSANSSDLNEQRIKEKLEQINREINRPVQPSDYSSPSAPRSKPQVDMSGDVERLEKLMQTMQNTTSEDPEMVQLNEMLDKIIAIQTPKLIDEKLKANQPVTNESAFNAIPAIIEGHQKVAPGGVVKLRLLDTIQLNGVVVPKGHLLFGSCNITNQRLLLTIKHIRLVNAIVPVDLSVFSLDGMIGIDAPEAELGEVAANGINDALQSMQVLSMDQSLGVQAAGAGINAAKNLIRKKVKRIRVKLKAGQPLLLRNNQPDKQ